MSLEKHKKYSSIEPKKGITLGEDSAFDESDPPFRSSVPVRIVNKNITESDNLEIKNYGKMI